MGGCKSTASTKAIVNGVPGHAIYHTRGLRHGDPISPLLFVIAIDALTTLFCRATDNGVINSICGISATQRLCQRSVGDFLRSIRLADQLQEIYCDSY